MEAACPVCRDVIEVGVSIQHECGHWSHALCLDENAPDFTKCASCKGEVDLSAPLLPEIEPGATDGHDYIAQPIQSITNRVKRRIMRSDGVIKGLLSGGPRQMPVDKLIREHEYGLQRCLQDGVTIDDFLSNGYTWSDLSLFQDLNGSKGVRRVQDALVALRCNAQHFRDYDHALPFAEVKEAAAVDAPALMERFGLYFPQNGQPMTVVDGASD